MVKNYTVLSTYTLNILSLIYGFAFTFLKNDAKWSCVKEVKLNLTCFKKPSQFCKKCFKNCTRYFATNQSCNKQSRKSLMVVTNSKNKLHRANISNSFCQQVFSAFHRMKVAKDGALNHVTLLWRVKKNRKVFFTPKDVLRPKCKKYMSSQILEKTYSTYWSNSWGQSYWWYLQDFEGIQITFQNAQKERKFAKVLFITPSDNKRDRLAV